MSEVKEITYVKEPLCPDDKIEEAKETWYELLMKSYHQAMQEGIKANTVVINSNMAKVQSFPMRTPIGGAVIIPTMICGLNVVFSKDELPDGYSFAVLEGPENRLAQFESIGMEPDELRKAAELYKKVKEVME